MSDNFLQLNFNKTEVLIIGLQEYFQKMLCIDPIAANVKETTRKTRILFLYHIVSKYLLRGSVLSENINL